jgi:hypothetical protein
MIFSSIHHPHPSDSESQPGIDAVEGSTGTRVALNWALL